MLATGKIVQGFEMLMRVGALDARDVKVLRDASYFLPDTAWVKGQFAPFLAKKYWAYMRAYIQGQFDCEDFSLEGQNEAEIEQLVSQVVALMRPALKAKLALAAATRCLVENKEAIGSGHGICYAEVSILPGHSLNGVRDGKHATLLAITPDGALFVEPQNSEITDATEALDLIKPHEDPDRPRNPSCSLDWVWV